MKVLDTSHVLSRIVDARRRRVSDAAMRVPEAIVRKMAAVADAPVSFRDAIGKAGRTNIIAEVKKASPSAGILIESLDVDLLASTYAAAGAAAVSVVTEEDFFQGNLGWVRQAARSSGLPVVRKDFVYSDYQVWETRAAGASAILLIAAMLDPSELAHLIRVATDAGLDALVEVHDREELDESLGAGATIIGVNNRNLKTFDVRLETSIELGAEIPDDILFVAESGIRTRADIERLKQAGANAFLVGEQLVRSANPGQALGELL
jgi:indole-3-glycerol phosphate synthase